MEARSIEFNEEIHLKRNELIAVYREMEGEFETINRLASIICGTPVSLVNFLDDDFQYSISKFGNWSQDSIGPKQSTICQYTVMDNELLVINDTRMDKRVRAIHGLEDQSIRFYAGMPIKSPSGIILGALCVIDFEPRQLTKEQLQSLRDLTKEAEYRIKLFKQNKQLNLNAKNLSMAAAFLNNSTDVLWTVDPKDFTILESRGANATLSIPDIDLLGERLFSLIQDLTVQQYLKNWSKREHSNKRMEIPVEIKLNSDNTKWLSITFCKYENSLLFTCKDITKQYNFEQKLKKSIEEKETLLSEVHHRVKNNLAIIHSLLMMERLNFKDEIVQNSFLNSESRIITISKIHEMLYKTKNFGQIELLEYVTNLLEALGGIYPLNERKIKFDLQISNIQLNVNQALPVGLIITELVTNAIKHAFKNKHSGLIHIIAFEKDYTTIHFEVKDNGNGIDCTPSELLESGSMGLTLVNTLKDQLEAEMNIASVNGMAFDFKFQKNNHKGTVSNMKYAS